MKQILFLLGLFTVVYSVYAQDAKVKSFKHLPMDLRARTDAVLDVNGDECALIVVRTHKKGMQFSPRNGKCKEVVYKNGEYYVYVSEGEVRLSFWAEGITRQYFDFPESILGQEVYEILLAVNSGSGLELELVQLSLQLNVSEVMISKDGEAPILARDNTVVFSLPQGNYSFEFYKQGYENFSQQIDVDGEKTVSVTLIEGGSNKQFQPPGIISLSSTPDYAELFLNGQKVGHTPYTEEAQPGHYTLMLQKEMYYPKTLEIDLESGMVKDLPQIKLKKKSGFMEINSSVIGAQVFVDNRLLGTTPLPQQEFVSGSHQLKLEHKLYHDYIENFEIIDGQVYTSMPDLKPAFGGLEIITQPAGADVYIDNVLKGQTPFSADTLKSRSYLVRVQKKLWETKSETITILDEEINKLNYMLDQDFGTLNVSAEGADIFLNSEKVGFSSYSADLSPGKYVVKATRPGYHEEEQVVFIIKGDSKDVQLTLRQAEGSVSIITQPPETKGADIFINNQLKGHSPIVLSLPIGEYYLGIKKENFKDYHEKIKIETNENQTLRITLQPQSVVRNYESNVQQDRNGVDPLVIRRRVKSYRKARNMSLGMTLAFAGAGTLFLASAQKHYDEYQTAVDNASELHDIIEQEDILWQLSYGLAAFCLIPTAIYSGKLSRAKAQLHAGITPMPGGVGLTAKVEF